MPQNKFKNFVKKKKKKLTKQDVLEMFAQLMAESDAKAEKRLAEFEASLQKSREEAEKRHAEAEKRHAKFEAAAEKRNKEFDKKMGSLTGFLGKFTEEMIRPNIIPMFQAKGIEVELVVRSVIGKKNNQDYYEIDWLLINSTIAVVVEVKTKFTKDEVDEHLDRLKKICEVAPPKLFNLSGITLLGAVAAITFENGVDRYAYQKGLYVLKQTGNLVSIIHYENFKPQEWKTNY